MDSHAQARLTSNNRFCPNIFQISFSAWVYLFSIMAAATSQFPFWNWHFNQKTAACSDSVHLIITLNYSTRDLAAVKQEKFAKVKQTTSS